MFLTRKDRSQTIKLTDPEQVDHVGLEAAVDGSLTVLREKSIIFDGGDRGYAIAVGQVGEHGRRVCAIRWNGQQSDISEGPLDVTGTPAQSNRPQWFVLPEFLWEPTVKACADEVTKEHTDALAWLNNEGC